MAGQGPARRRRVEVAPQPEHIINHSTTNGDMSSSIPSVMMAGPVISDGARLTYADLHQASPPQDPPSSVPLAPVIYDAITYPTQEQARLVLSPGCEDEEIPPIFVMQRHDDLNNDTTIERAYALLPHKPHKPLQHGDPTFPREWGRLYQGMVYQRDHSSKHDIPTFRVPNLEDKAVLTSATPDNPIFVAIKMIDKKAVAHSLGGKILSENVYRENPYKEIARMQEIGDNHYVIKCLDALQDENFLYIITPWALGGDLKDFIWNPMAGHFDKNEMLWSPATMWTPQAAAEPSTIGSYFCQILDILAYLERFNIHHRDGSPDNFLFLDKERKILVAMDFALSVRIPIITTTAATVNQSLDDDEEEEPQSPSQQQQTQRTLINPLGEFGTPGWMAPETYDDCAKVFAFDGVGCDLWPAMLILYNMLTRQILYLSPHTTDISFRYFVHAGGLRKYNSINERTIQILMEVFNDDGGNLDEDAAAGRKLIKKTLLTKAQAHIEFSDDIRELFHNFFRTQPTERWTLAQVMESNYVQQHRRRQQQQSQQQQQQQQQPQPQGYHHHYSQQDG